MKPLVTPLIKDERVIEENKYGKKVMYRDFEYPDGTVHDFLIWGDVREINPSMAFALTEKNEVIAIRQFRPAANEIVIEIPGGCTNGGEDPTVVARRELLEETGYEASDVIPLMTRMWPEPASCFTSFGLFLALGCRKVAETKHDEVELMEVIVVPLNEWIDMIHRGEIRDGKTITATFLALPHLGLEIKAKN